MGSSFISTLDRYQKVAGGTQALTHAPAAETTAADVIATAKRLHDSAGDGAQAATIALLESRGFRHLHWAGLMPARTAVLRDSSGSVPRYAEVAPDGTVGGVKASEYLGRLQDRP